ncbi:NADP-dependent malic enzyme [Patescibacteria group bacterium]|nr:NADP-dependent malic enzyme [Patescibacteria group bacterium]
MDLKEKALNLHKQLKGKLEINSKIKLDTKESLSLAYTPGVAEPSKVIAEKKEAVYDYTIKGNTIAIVSDGSAVLGLGNIGPEAALPVMEGKAAIFKEFADIDAFPICLDTQDTDEIVRTVELISPVFGGINLEDISAPRCFEIEERLQNIGIPVFHDDQHGTAIVLLAGLINASKLAGKKMEDLKVVISGAGAAGTAITRLLKCVNHKNEDGVCVPVRDILVCDSKGIIHSGRADINKYKKEIAQMTNFEEKSGGLGGALVGADVFIGVSAPGILTGEMIKTMNEKPIVFAMANPTPEIMPDEAKEAGVFIMATGRSDFPNQVNNALAFPGIFRGALDIRAKKITPSMKLAAAYALAEFIKSPTPDEILPPVTDRGIVKAIAEAVRDTWKDIND